MKRLVMMRGLPGSGKSTLAHEIAKQHKNSVVLGTDDYFIDEDGNFNFNYSKNDKSADWNYSEFLKALAEDINLIIIDNPNTKYKSMKCYVERGVEYGYEIEFAMPDNPWMWNVEILEDKNIHGVYYDIIDKMKEDFEHNATIEKVLKSKRV